MILFIIALLCMFIYIIFDLKKAFHMLQQNWYNDGLIIIVNSFLFGLIIYTYLSLF